MPAKIPSGSKGQLLSQRLERWWRRSRLFGFLLVLSLILCLSIPNLAERGLAQEVPSSAQVQDLEHQGRQFYESGQYQDAIAYLQHAIEEYEAQGDSIRQAIALSNLALVHHHLGQWEDANDAIVASLSLLNAESSEPVDAEVLAQVLNVQGRLQLAQGQAEMALATWQQATALFEETEDLAAIAQTTLNRVQALQTLGLYRQAIARLEELHQSLQHQPVSLVQVEALRSLGDALLASGSLSQSRTTLEQSLALAEQLPSSSQTQEAIAKINLSFGNLVHAEAVATLGLSNLTPTEAVDLFDAERPDNLSLTEVAILQQRLQAAQGFYEQTEAALDFYQQAADAANTIHTRIQAELNLLSLLVETERRDRAYRLYPTLQRELDTLPLNHDTLYAQINVALSVAKLSGGDAQFESSTVVEHERLQQPAQWLMVANQKARSLGDARAQSYALGSLGELYEQTQQWQTAQSLTEQALLLSQSIHAIDISYRWQWQLGRILNAQQDEAGAIAAYQEAVHSLQSLRSDLVAVNQTVQFSFREQVEPIYRGLVELLLRPGGTDPDLDKLIKARDVIEGLQVAELDNFFREACLDTEFQLDRVVDQAQQSAAILYTIVLPDRVEVILKLPQQSLRHYTTTVSQETVEETVDRFLIELRRPYATRLLETLSQQLYDWLIRPAAVDLHNNDIDTLVFVLDGSLRSVPMAALYDGQQYLVEDYAVAIAPGLQIPDPKPLQPEQLRALVAGLSEARSNFPPLNYVAEEIQQIQSDLPSQVLFNQDFTRDQFQQLVNAAPFSVVHIATHGQFSSNADDTFILTWDHPLRVNDLGSLLQMRDLTSPEPIELLVLSACQTAVGDRRASLGLAGMAVRAGARSTIASLWNLDDQSGALFMNQFYEALVSHSMSKAEALRRAQLGLLANPQYDSPRFWAPYVLLGNWL